MRQYSSFQALYQAFFSKSLYKDVGQNWQGVAAGYLLLLLIVVWIPALFFFKFHFDSQTAHSSRDFLKQIPSIRILDGVVSVDKPMPYRITHPKSGKAIAVIDTTGQITSLEQAAAPILVTKDKLMVQKSGQETQIFNLSNVKDVKIDALKVKQFMARMTQWIIYIFFPVLVIITFIYRILQALLFGAVGMLIAKILQVNIFFQQSMRLAVVAMTPAIMLSTLLFIFGISFAYEYFIYFVISLSYLIFGISANK